MISAKVVAASSARGCPDIVTLHLRMPRLLLAEFNTHRVFSRNARSSRAVPVSRTIEEVETDPFVPLVWTAAAKGMSGPPGHETPIRDDLSGGDLSPRDSWILAGREMASIARRWLEAGYHKQVINRLLEPWLWVDVLVTATEWDNFLLLRDHPDAEPHMQILAREIRKTLEDAAPVPLLQGEWHLPYVSPDEHLRYEAAGDIETLRRLSAVRCARISYRPFDGQDSLEAEMVRWERLSGDPVHASPMEHQASPDPEGWHAHHHGNFRGWIQFRKLLPGEATLG